MKKLLKFLRPYRLLLTIAIILLLAQAFMELFLPTLMADIVNDGIVGAQIGETYRINLIIRIGIQMLAVALLAGASSIISMYLSQKTSAGAARDLRNALFTKIESFSQTEFDKFSSASLITRCTNDISQVQGLANMTARLLLYAPIVGIGGVTMALSRSPSMGWIIALSVILLIGFAVIIIKTVMPKFKIIQEMVDRLNKISREILHGLMVIRAFATQSYEKERFSNINTDLKDMGLYVGRVLAVIGPAMTFIMGITQMLIIWVGAEQISRGNLQVGDMMAFFQYAMMVLFSFMMVTMVLIMIPRALVSAGRIVEVLDTDIIITDPKNPLEFDNKPAVVEFNNVSFIYPQAEEAVLHGISFTAKPGETTAIIGATGAGKSTLAHLILRFYDVTEGSIKIAGHDIREVRQEALRKKIGFVPQKGQLISGTIASNICYGMPDLQINDMQNIAKVAQATDFIEEREEKYESEISQGGANVSGGQKQRLSIARALAVSPEILVFDDSFSALDFQTDAKLRLALKEHISNATVIVIAQRVGTIMSAEQIIVLEDGEIVGRGTHNELIKTCTQYKEIAQSQGVE